MEKVINIKPYEVTRNGQRMLRQTTIYQSPSETRINTLREHAVARVLGGRATPDQVKRVINIFIGGTPPPVDALALPRDIRASMTILGSDVQEQYEGSAAKVTLVHNRPFSATLSEEIPLRTSS